MKKKLYRSNDSVVCGVCAGIAEYFNISPWVVRTIFLVVAIACKLVPLLVYVPILLYLGLAFIYRSIPMKNIMTFLPCSAVWANKKKSVVR